MHAHELSEAARLRSHHSDLFRTERSCLADLLASVGDFERRGLGMSKGMAHYRMVAARLVRRFPEVEEAVRGGRPVDPTHLAYRECV